MSISPWRPLRDLVNTRDDMFRNFFSGFMETFPRLDIYQTDKEVVITTELPGLSSKDDIEITATENTLTIRGEIKGRNLADTPQYHHRERYYGSFTRNMNLPVQVQPEKASATYKNGILDIRIPVAENRQQKQIPVDLS